MDGRPVWHEDRELWEMFQEFLFTPEHIEKASDQIDQVHSLLGLDADQTPDSKTASGTVRDVLDIPCGVGRHTAALAERGYSVTAVDATLPYLDAARERVEENGTVPEASVEFVHEDMRSFRREESYDLVINLYTSFGYFEDRADDERTARNFFASLRPGGRLVMSLASKETLAAKFEERTWDERDGAYMLEVHAISDDWSWMENRWILIHDGKVHEFEVSHRLYSAYELRELLKRVGFSEVTVYDGLDGSDFDENAEKLVVVAEK